MASDRIVIGSLCYLFYQDQVLLLKRVNPPYIGLWSPPGGKMDFGESPQACCIREIYEETSIRITSPVLRGIQTVMDKAVPIHWQLFIFRADLHQPAQPIAQHNHQEGEMRWFHIDDVEALNRPYPDRQYWSAIVNPTSDLWQARFIFDTPDNLIEETIYSRHEIQ